MAKSKSSKSNNTARGITKPLISIDASQFPPPVLRKYRNAYNLRVSSAKSSSSKNNGGAAGHGGKRGKDELAGTVARHFKEQEVKETEAITYFLYSIKHKGKLLKLPPPRNL